MGIVLASGSPRRLELLQMIGLTDFKVIPDTSKEEMDLNLSPEQTVCAIALKKASNVSRLCENDDMIIAADTLVYLGGRPIGKPAGPEDAAWMLKELSGRKHTVYTGIVVLKDGTHITATEKTDVFFRGISDSEISAYVESGEPMDKAGAYAAQGRGAVFVERIEGDFFNVMGLPLCRLVMLLRGFGVTL
jgi:septum formation protein